MALSPGSRVGNFEVLELLGKGGMGEVYRARDLKLGREVALKTLPAAVLNDAERSARFAREARVLASLDHPNIGAIYGVEEAEGTRALVLALVEGPTLADRLRSGALPVDEAAGIARQIAEAIEYAHERGVVHRDLKPANVKITPEGTVKVLDFGLAKALDGEPGAGGSDASTITMGSTQVGTILGTAAYMSPEQAAGKRADRRSDIWSFGVMLYEMLTGKRLFTGDTVSEVLAGVIKDTKNLDAVPEGYRGLVGRCLQRDPRKRLQAIGEARIVLEEGGAEAPLRAEARSSGRLAWGVAVAASLIALGVLVWGVWRTGSGGEAPLLRLSVDLGTNALVGTNLTAAISPDGKKLVYPAKGPNGDTSLALRLLDQPGETILPDTKNAADPFFSPDGLWVAFFADGKLKKISVQGGAPVAIADANNPRGGTWTEGGTIVAALSNVAALEAVSSNGGARRTVTRLEGAEATHRWPRALPGGETVLFTASTSIDVYDQAAIEAVNLRTGARTKVWEGGYGASYAAGRLLYLLGRTMFAAPFDAAALKVTGSSVPVVTDVGSNLTTGGGQYDIAQEAGVLAYYSGERDQGGQVTWLQEGVQPVSLLADRGVYYTPRFTHDGKRMAIQGADSDLYVSDLQSTLARLTFSPRASYGNPVFTPDDKYIAFTAHENNGSRLAWVRATGGEPVFLSDTAVDVQPMDFSKNGTRLFYAQVSPQTNWDIWTLPLDLTDPDRPRPGKPELFLGTELIENAPAISPDGRWIAYHANETGRNEVYVRPLPPAGNPPSGLRWQVSREGGRWPRWSSNGRDLYFQALPPDNRAFAAAYTAQGDSFLPGKLRAISETKLADLGYPAFDVHPDGKRLAAVPAYSPATESTAANVHLTFLVNFFDMLRTQ